MSVHRGLERSGLVAPIYNLSHWLYYPETPATFQCSLLASLLAQRKITVNSNFLAKTWLK